MKNRRTFAFLALLSLIGLSQVDVGVAQVHPTFASAIPNKPGNGCGGNAPNFEPAIRVSPQNRVFIAGILGAGNGTDFWRAHASGNPCASLEYLGRPDGLPLANTIDGLSGLKVGYGGGDADIAVAPNRNILGTHTLYLTSLDVHGLYGGNNVRVSSSRDNGTTWINTPVRVGLSYPGDRPWIAAYGSTTSLLTYKTSSAGIGVAELPVLRSDTLGLAYVQIGDAFAPTSRGRVCMEDNSAGNIAIDHRNPGLGFDPVNRFVTFRAYRAFSAALISPPSATAVACTPRGDRFIYLAASNDGGFTWVNRQIPCSRSRSSLNHVFVSVSIEPSGAVWAAWSDETAVFAARSTDQGATWTCQRSSVSGLTHAIEPWLVATDRGVALVYYGAVGPDGPSQRWHILLTRLVPPFTRGWSSITTLVDRVLDGEYCDVNSSRTCPPERTRFPLLELPQADVDQLGRTHIAYTTARPPAGSLGAPATAYAAQRSGDRVGQKN